MLRLAARPGLAASGLAGAGLAAFGFADLEGGDAGLAAGLGVFLGAASPRGFGGIVGISSERFLKSRKRFGSIV